MKKLNWNVFKNNFFHVLFYELFSRHSYVQDTVMMLALFISSFISIVRQTHRSIIKIVQFTDQTNSTN